MDGAGIPCAFDLPELPRGVELDQERVNVDLTTDDGEVALDFVVRAEDCLGEPGWYYDDPFGPTQLVLCPAACNAGALEVHVEFGCAQRKRP